MPSFRWPELSNDIALAKEVMSSRPEKPNDWDSIANKLAYFFSEDVKPVLLKGRGCRDRMELLLRKFKEEDSKALKRFGTEEDYSELHQLLEDINSYVRDFTALKATQVAYKAAHAAKKTEDDKKKAEEMRRAAVEGRRRSSSDVSETLDISASSSIASLSDNEDQASCSHVQPSGKKRKTASSNESSNLSSCKRSSRLTGLQVFERRNELKMAVKEKELALRERELALQEKKLGLDEADRKKRLELDVAERKTRLELDEADRAQRMKLEGPSTLQSGLIRIDVDSKPNRIDPNWLRPHCTTVE